jgi:hypothetical protein
LTGGKLGSHFGEKDRLAGSFGVELGLHPGARALDRAISGGGQFHGLAQKSLRAGHVLAN